MIQRRPAVTDGRRMGDGAADVLLGAPSRVGQIVSERETGRDRRRERATSAVSVTAVDPWGTEFVKRVPVEQQVHHFQSRSVTSSNDHRGSAHVENPSRRVARIFW